MLELLQEGARLLLQRSASRNRKTPFTVVAVRRPSDLRVVPLVSVAANLLARKLILPSLFPEATSIKPEVTRGGSRFDFLVEEGERRTWAEVKSCTLEAEGVAMFPDAATARGRRHVEELAAIAGDRRLVLFVLQGLRATRFVPDIHADPAFSLALREAQGRGVGVRAAAVDCDARGVATLRDLNLPVDLSPVRYVEEDSGSYLLHLHLAAERELSVGSLGSRRLCPGHYLYVGSAMRGLAARTRRHLNRRKRLHWHVDHLRSVAEAARVYPIYSRTRLECSLAESLRQLYPEPVEGFGSSDCRCRSHLFYLPGDPRRDPRFVEILLRYRHRLALT
jgi:sugar fermentation stimulation protein A